MLVEAQLSKPPGIGAVAPQGVPPNPTVTISRYPTGGSASSVDLNAAGGRVNAASHHVRPMYSGAGSMNSGSQAAHLPNLRESPTMLSGDDNNLITSSASERRVMHLQYFFELNYREACRYVQMGRHLVKRPTLKNQTGQHTPFRDLVGRAEDRIRRDKQHFFIVTRGTTDLTGLSELRWDPNEECAKTDKAHGRIRLNQVRYVTPTILQDVEEDETSSKKDNLQNREFRVISTDGRTLRLCAPDRESMKYWVIGLLHLSRQARKRSQHLGRKAVDPALWNSIVQDMQRTGAADANRINVNDLTALSLSAHFGGNLTYLNEVFAEFDRDGSGEISLQDVAALIQAFLVKDTLSPWFRRYATVITASASETHGVSLAKFREFMQVVQKEINVDRDYFARLDDPHVMVDRGTGETYLTEAGFTHLLCNPKKNSIFDPRHSRIFQDMSRPLTHYWIASSHNTYLSGDQLFSRSSLDQYIDVLMRGCRCVEIDCWDGEDGEPIVTHGWTGTTRISFIDVVRVCRDYGFVVSPYPLILSLEVHCGPRQLVRMGQILNSELGPKLLRLEMDVEDAELTSPQDARRKVIVKGKVPSDVRQDMMQRQDGMRKTNSKGSKTSSQGNCMWRCMQRLMKQDQSKEDSDEEDDKIMAAAAECRASCVAVTGSAVSGLEPGEAEALPQIEPQGQGQLPKPQCANSVNNNQEGLARRSSRRLGVPGRTLLEAWSHQAVDMTGLEDYGKTLYLVAAKPPKPEEEDPASLHPCNVLSFNETKAMQFAKKRTLEEAQSYHHQHLSRVYPLASRVSSENFDPVPLWLRGFQMVALNYQSCDIHTIVNDGLFRNENGGCGYILKPTCPSVPPTAQRLPSMGSATSSVPFPTLRRGRGRQHLVLEEPAIGCNVSLRILSGQCFPRPPSALMSGTLNPTVRVTLCGDTGDKESFETEQVADDGFSPSWNKSFIFQVDQPVVAVLAFEVLHHASAASTAQARRRPPEKKQSKESINRGGVLVAAAAFPLTGIREGLRWVQLLDVRQQEIERCGLLVEIEMAGPFKRERHALCP